jgi:hypothetical protein
VAAAAMAQVVARGGPMTMAQGQAVRRITLDPRRNRLEIWRIHPEIPMTKIIF